MGLENPQNNLEQFPKIQTIDDIDFELVEEGDPDFESAVSVVNTNGKKTPEELLAEAKKEVVRVNWWLQDKWIEKGIPNEQVTLVAGDLTIELYNYGQELTPSQLEEAKRIVATLSQASVPDQNSLIKYVTINDTDELNDQNGENKRGYAFTASKMLSLYPRAVSAEPHRIPETSGFAGTLAHEFGHFYLYADDNFLSEWKDKFGWRKLSNEEVDWSKHAPKTYATDQAERCVTDYAQFSPDEDICESLAAAVNNPAVLDQEKLAFIKEHWFKEGEMGAVETSLERKTAMGIQMPQVPDKIKYKAKIKKFEVRGN